MEFSQYKKQTNALRSPTGDLPPFAALRAAATQATPATAATAATAAQEAAGRNSRRCLK